MQQYPGNHLETDFVTVSAEIEEKKEYETADPLSDDFRDYDYSGAEERALYHDLNSHFS
jgi:hypothetical protein